MDLLMRTQSSAAQRCGAGDVATVECDLPGVSINALSRLASAESSEPHFSSFCLFRE